MKILPCPCDNCLIVPICKYKSWKSLVRECDIVEGYFFKKGKRNKWVLSEKSIKSHIERVQICMRPTRWKTADEGECYWVYEVMP